MTMMRMAHACVRVVVPPSKNPVLSVPVTGKMCMR